MSQAGDAEALCCGGHLAAHITLADLATRASVRRMDRLDGWWTTRDLDRDTRSGQHDPRGRR